MENYYGNYRAKVIDNDDKKKWGRVKVWIPDLMPEVDESKGLWSWPANNPVGGRNKSDSKENNFMGTSYIPNNSSWVFVFFEGGNPNRPFYFGSLDLEMSDNTPSVLPEVSSGTNKWVIFKSHEGRTIVISDNPDDPRVEITGKKTKLKTPPHGDEGSVYTVDGNQTVILLDERSSQEKILIRSHKGDYINFDIKRQKLQIYCKKDIIIESGGSLHLKAKDDIRIEGKNIYLTATQEAVHIRGKANVNIEAGGIANINSGGATNINSAALVAIDGTGVAEMSGAATVAIGQAKAADAESPEGQRGE
jgi:hypothetical protein